MLNSNTKDNFSKFMFDPKEPNGIQHLRSHLRSRLNSKVTERDRTGVVANAILNGQRNFEWTNNNSRKARHAREIQVGNAKFRQHRGNAIQRKNRIAAQ